MRSLPLVFAILAVIAGAIAVTLWLSRDSQQPDLFDELGTVELEEPQAPDSLQVGVEAGGVFAGTVVDGAGKPIEGARVLLVAFNAGNAGLLSGRGTSGRPFDPGDPESVPIIGDYRVGGREAETGPDGRFVIPAHPRSRVTHVLAFHRTHFLNVVEVPGPTDGIVVRLLPAGRVLGHVVDNRTGASVPNAMVEVYLQHPTALAPEVGRQAGGANAGRRGAPVERSAIAMLGHFLSKELGERVWGIPYQGTEALRLRTDEDGRFEVGPLGEGVQLEFVVTHEDYKWYDFDTDGGTKRARRTIVTGGQTVERELRLREGLEIKGVVLDDRGEPIPDVTVASESITQYLRHWYDAQGKPRFARTDGDGRFHLKGLALGKHNLTLTHEAFGKVREPGVVAHEPGSNKTVEIVIRRKGRVIGTVQGLTQRPLGGRVHVTLVPMGDDVVNMSRMRHQRHVLDRLYNFALNDVVEGRYQILIHVDDDVSRPQEIEVVAGDPVRVTFELGGGGHLEARVRTAEGAAVDPAVAMLIAVDGEEERPLGRYVARQGVIETDSILPGRYRLEIDAPGFAPKQSEVFDVLAGRPTDIGILTLEPYAYFALKSVQTERRENPPVSTKIEYRVNDGPWKHLLAMAALDIPIKPGTLDVRANTNEGLSFEQTYDAAPGQVTEVRVVLR